MKNKTWLVWSAVLIVFVFFYLGGTSALRAQMEAALASACNRPVSVRSAQVIFPPGVRLSHITVPAYPRERVQPLSIGQIEARMAGNGFLQGPLAVDLRILQPKMFMAWTPYDKEMFSLASLKGTSTPVALPLSRLRLEAGELTLLDETVIPATQWNLRDLEGEFAAGQAPGQYRFRFSSRLVTDSAEDIGLLKVEGTWVSGGPLDATLEIRHRNLKVLAPYLCKVLGTPPAKGRAELTTRLTIHQGVVMARNDVIAEEVSFPSDAVTTLDLEGNRLVDLLRDEEGKVHLGFIVAGKLGKKLNWSDMATGALREAMRQAVSRSIQKVLKENEESRPAGEVLQEKFDSTPR